MDKDMHSSQLNVETTNQSDNLASYLDWTFTVEKGGKLSTKQNDMRDDFGFSSCQFSIPVS